MRFTTDSWNGTLPISFIKLFVNLSLTSFALLLYIFHPSRFFTEPNEDEIFMVSMAKDMQKITNERTRRRLKRKIFELTAEAIEED